MASYNIVHHLGIDGEFHINVSNSAGNPLDLTVYIANAIYRKHYLSANSIAFTSNLYANGLLKLTLPANTAVANDVGIYFYSVDINFTASNTVTRVQDGLLTIRP